MNVEEVGNDKGRVRMNDGKEMKVKRVRRGGKNRSLKEEITILYSNVQGFNGKKASLAEIFEVVNPDVCLLAETMVMKTKLDGCKAINPVKSIGQNVAIMVLYCIVLSTQRYKITEIKSQKLVRVSYRVPCRMSRILPLQSSVLSHLRSTSPAALDCAPGSL